MAEQNSNAKTTPLSTHKIELDHLRGASMTGVVAVPVFTDKSVTVKLKDETLNILGADLEIKHLDIENGKLTLSGKVNSLKYSASSTPTSLFKRILK